MRALSTALVCTAMVFYGIENALIERHFSKNNQFVTMLFMYTPLVFLSIIICLCSGNMVVTMKSTETGMGAKLMTTILLCLCSFFILKQHIKMDFPYTSTHEMAWIVIAGLLFFAADICFFGAYRLGITAETVTTTALLIPISTSVFKMCMKWSGYPNKYTVIAWCLGAMMLLAIAKSQQDE